MFKLAAKRVVLWPVTVKAPREDGSGEVDEVGVRLRFELLTTDELVRRAEGASEDVALLKRKIRGWEDIADSDGNPLAFNDANLEAALAIPYVRLAFILALLEASSGRAAVKNSGRGSAGT